MRIWRDERGDGGSGVFWFLVHIHKLLYSKLCLGSVPQRKEMNKIILQLL